MRGSPCALVLSSTAGSVGGSASGALVEHRCRAIAACRRWWVEPWAAMVSVQAAPQWQILAVRFATPRCSARCQPTRLGRSHLATLQDNIEPIRSAPHAGRAGRPERPSQAAHDVCAVHDTGQELSDRSGHGPRGAAAKAWGVSVRSMVWKVAKDRTARSQRPRSYEGSSRSLAASIGSRAEPSAAMTCVRVTGDSATMSVARLVRTESQ